MPRSTQDILDHAHELAKRFEDHQPEPGSVLDATPLRELRQAVVSRAAAESDVAKAVARAREAGTSWSSIAAMLGTSGEAARQRYGKVRT